MRVERPQAATRRPNASSHRLHLDKAAVEVSRGSVKLLAVGPWYIGGLSGCSGFGAFAPPPCVFDVSIYMYAHIYIYIHICIHIADLYLCMRVYMYII